MFAYAILGYGIQRHETLPLIGTYFVLFAIYVWLVKASPEEELKFWIYASILFRLVMLFSIPILSDDFYRFIWDGRLLVNGIHPFAQLPGYYLENANAVNGLDQFLYDHLNSQDYFTVYPPFSQIIFWISTILFPNSILGSVMVMRILILAAEMGTLALISKLLENFKIDAKNILIYALNPLVILELSGNLHFEAFVIFFLLLAIYLLTNKNIWQAGITLGLSISAKLLPLILLPLFLTRLGIKRSILLYLSTAFVVALFFIPFFNMQIIDGFAQSLSLYFKKFEFNASIYYLVREYGFYSKGYNTIQTVGWKLGVITSVGILIISFWTFALNYENGKWRLKRDEKILPDLIKGLPSIMVWILTFYFLMTTTLHPWYLTTLIALSLFTPYRFVLVWSALIFLTYAGYSANGYSENLYLVAIEYVIVIGYLVYELIWGRKLAYI